MSWQFEAYAFVGIAAPVSSCDRRRGRRCGVVTEDRIAVDASAQADDPDQARAEPVSFSGERHRRLRCSLGSACWASIAYWLPAGMQTR